jgi:O-antigen/teichoic acid export membrane protein
LQTRSEQSRTARNAATSYAARFVLGLSALILTPYLFRRLGVGGFGTWSIVFTLATIARLLEVGFSGGIVKLVAEARARRDRTELERLVGAAAVLMAALGIAGALFFTAAAFALEPLAAAAHRDDFHMGLLVLAATMLLRIPLSAYAAVLNGYQRFDLFNASNILTTVGFSVGAVIAVEAGTGVLGVTVAYAAGLMAGGLFFVGSLRRLDPHLRLGALGDAQARRRILGFSSLTLLADSMVFVAQRMDVVIIAAVRNAAVAAPYAAAVKLQSALQALTLPFMNLLMPMVAELWTLGRRDVVVERVRLATRVTVQLTLPVAFAIALFAEDIVGVWLGASAPALTATIVVVLMAVQTATLTATPAEKALIGMGRVRVVSAVAVVEGLANVGATVALVWAYGAVGAALGTLLTNAVIGPIRIPLACRALRVPVGSFLLRSVGVAVLSSAPALAAMTAIRIALGDGAARPIAGIAVGLTLAVIVGAAQVGPRRLVQLIAAGLGGRGATADAGTTELGSPLTAGTSPGSSR